MKTLLRIGWFLILVVLVAGFAGLSIAQEGPPLVDPYPTQQVHDGQLVLSSSQDIPQIFPRVSDTGNNHLDRSQRFAGQSLQVKNSSPDLADAACFQMLVNSSLNAVIVDGVTGTAEPWVPLYDIVYIDSVIYNSASHSLFLADADGPDPSPTFDGFGQGFFMPDNLTKVTINFFSGTLNTSNLDSAFGNIYTLDDNFIIEKNVVWWEVPDSDNTWKNWTVELTDTTDKALLEMMQGKALAIVFDSETNGSPPGELAYFDDITIEACVNTPPTSGKAYLPTLFNKFGVAPDPVCIPPNENPQDQYNANRGRVETGATCKSTLSSLDRADYYAFTPSKSGPHTLRLTNLPSGTEWSAMLFTDTEPPSYADGPTGPEKDCRIGTPGWGQKEPKEVTCDLQKNVPLIVKVSAGSTPILGEYTMRITQP